jgi:hypothetical protein
MATAGWIVACLCAGSALAQGGDRETAATPRPLHDYRSTTQHALIACASAFSARESRPRSARAVGDFRNCVVKARTEVAQKLDAAVRTLDVVACAAALRSYNLAFEKALLGIEPQPGESPLAYEQRQIFLFHGMAHAWGRFELAESLAN